MGLAYTAAFNVGVFTVQDLFEITAPSNAVVKILSCQIGQRDVVGNDEAEMVPIVIARYTGADGTGGTTPTPRPLNIGYPVAGSVVRANTTEGATKTRLISDVFNVQAGWLYKPPPREMIVLSPRGKLAIYLSEVPAHTFFMRATLTFEEIGG